MRHLEQTALSGTSRQPRNKIARVLFACATFVGIVGCQQSELEGTKPPLHQVEQFLTGSAAGKVNAVGQMIMGQASLLSQREITQGQAELLALTWSRRYAPMDRTFLVQGHGADIAFDQLKVCGRTYYAASAFVLDDVSNDAALQRGIGPFWLVGMCQGAQLTLSVAVSSLATNVTVQNGLLVWDASVRGGGEFFGLGVPSTWQGPVRTDPEHAVIAAGTATSRMISEVPQLIAPSPLRGPPQAAVWLITLSGSATLRGAKSQTVRTLPQVYHGLLRLAVGAGPVSNESELVIPSVDQPLSVTFGDARSQGGLHVVRVRAGVAVQFEGATVAGGN